MDKITTYVFITFFFVTSWQKRKGVIINRIMCICIRLLQISVIILLLCSDISRGDIKFDFRKIRWGMTKEEVKKSETLKLIKGIELDAKEIVSYGFDEIITYYDRTAKAQIHYVFLNDRLVSVLQLFADQYEKQNYLHRSIRNV